MNTGSHCPGCGSAMTTAGCINSSCRGSIAGRVNIAPQSYDATPAIPAVPSARKFPPLIEGSVVGLHGSTPGIQEEWEAAITLPGLPSMALDLRVKEHFDHVRREAAGAWRDEAKRLSLDMITPRFKVDEARRNAEAWENLEAKP